MTNPAPPPYSSSRRAGGLVFTAGHIGRDDDGVIADGLMAQTQLALENLERTLQRDGLSRSDVVRTTVYLADMSLWAGMNEPYRVFFSDPFPARSAVAVGLPAGVLVEIEAVADAG